MFVVYFFARKERVKSIFQKCLLNDEKSTARSRAFLLILGVATKVSRTPGRSRSLVISAKRSDVRRCGVATRVALLRSVG